MNPTTDSQALLTKTFLNFTLCFFPVTCLLPNSNSTFPYSLLLCPTTSQQRKNHLTITTISTLSIYLFYLYNARVTNTESQSQNPKKKKKKKKKKKNTNSSVQFGRSTSTKSPNQFSNFSSSVKTQTRNTQTPQAQFL